MDIITGSVSVTKTTKGCEYAAELCKDSTFKLKAVRASKAEVTFSLKGDLEAVRARAYATMAKVGGAPEFKFQLDKEEDAS